MQDGLRFERDGNSLALRPDGGPSIQVDMLTSRIARLRFGRPDPASSFLPGREWPGIRMRVGRGTPLRIESGSIVLTASPQMLTFRDLAGAPRLHLEFRSVRLAPHPSLPLEMAGEQHLYGLGGQGTPFDRLGATRRLWNSHVNHGLGADVAIPLLVSNKGYGLFFDDANRAQIDPGASNDATFINYTSEGEGIDLYYLSGTNLRDVLADVADLLGQTPMPPRWALGYLQSTRHFDDERELRDLPLTFGRKGMPCDAMILLSTYSDFRGWNRGVGHLEIHPDLIPDPGRFFAGLREQHVHVVTHEYPVLHAESPLYAEARDKRYLLETGYPEVTATARPSVNYHEGQRHINFSSAEVREWWWRQHRPLVDAGVDGWWLDGGEGPVDATLEGLAGGLHNRFDLWRQQAFFEGEMRDRPDRRPFLLCRSGGPGMQRFAAACWSGDVSGTFTALEAQIAIGLNMGMSGVPYWGTDIGGYYPTISDSDELFARWFQFGAFCPIFRAHGRDWRKHLPWGRGKDIEAICRLYIGLRYELMPYTYTLAWQGHRLGLPLMRPLVLDHPQDPRVHDLGSQFLWGDDLLVAPVTREGATNWPVYLPAGVWYDFWTHEAHQGPGAITVAARLERLPLFVRSGALLPMGPAVRQDGDLGNSEINVLVYPAGESSFTLYEDDGSSNAYLSGGYALTNFSCIVDGHTITCAISYPQGDARVLPGARSYVLRVLSPGAPRNVEVVGGAARGLNWRYDDGNFVILRGLEAGSRVILAF